MNISKNIKEWVGTIIHLEDKAYDLRGAIIEHSGAKRVTNKLVESYRENVEKGF